MQSNQELINDVINDVLVDWAEKFIRFREDSARKNLGKASGSGHASFDHSTQKASGAQLARALFLFNTYLRFADIKSKNWSVKMPPVEKIEKWLEDKGIEKFKRKYQSKYGSIPASSEKLLNKIAWGIAIKIRQRGRLKKKRIPWLKPGADKGLAVLSLELGDRLPKKIADGLANELNLKNLTV